MELLLLFQRHLLANICTPWTSLPPPPLQTPSPETGDTTAAATKDQAIQHVQGALAVLVKYVSMLHHHVIQVLPMASQLVSLSPRHFRMASRVLRVGPAVTLLPELSVSLVLLQLQLPFKFLENKCVPIIGEVVKLLDDFNQLAPGAFEEDEQDLSWPDTHSE